MYKEKFLSYVKSGFIAGIITAIVSVVTFMVSSFIFGFSIEVIGESRDTLYVVFIVFVSFFAVLIGTLLFYLLQKFTNRPTLYFIIVVFIGFLGNTYMAEADLLEQYKTAGHLVHVIVAGLAVYLIPKLNRK